MVVTLNIKNYDVHHILIDNESSIDVLFYDALSNGHTVRMNGMDRYPSYGVYWRCYTS